MKKLFLLIGVLGSSMAFSQDFDLRQIGSSLQLDFNKGYVCAVEPAFSKAPTLGYGQTQNLARANAINNCIKETGNARMHCDDVKCEEIAFNGKKPTISVSVVNNQIGVRFSAGANHSCVAVAAFGGGLFIAEAPTRKEAEVFAQKLCMEQTGNARMHCDVESCEKIGGASGRIRLGDIFPRLN